MILAGWGLGALNSMGVTVGHYVDARDNGLGVSYLDEVAEGHPRPRIMEGLRDAGADARSRTGDEHYVISEVEHGLEYTRNTASLDRVVSLVSQHLSGEVVEGRLNGLGLQSVLSCLPGQLGSNWSDGTDSPRSNLHLGRPLHEYGEHRRFLGQPTSCP